VRNLKDLTPRVGSAFLLALFGCGLEQAHRADSLQSPVPSPVVARLQQEVQGDLERYVGAQQAAVLKALARAKTAPAAFKRPVIVQALMDPWSGMAALEQHGHRIAALAASGAESLPALIAAMEAGMDRAPESFTPIPMPSGTDVEEHVAYLVSILEQAHALREKALRRLSPDDRRFLFDHAASIAENFSPQLEGLAPEIRPQAESNLRFGRLVNEQLDYAAMIAAAQVLARLADERWLKRVASAVHGRPLVTTPPSGITGEVLLVRETPYGLIVIGGPGPNTYELDGRFALVLDVGGDDTYRGAIAASSDVEHGISVVIDLAGNDTYQGSPLGLATGRLGVGLLIDLAGDDVYHLAQGSGGAGFAGLGILVDAAGNDQYLGSRLTQGAAVGGLGLLLDLAGRDTYTSFGYAIGFGGPSGVGAVVDVAGDDRYQCGDKYSSRYNAIDLPDGKPGDPRFQYECFGIGAGSGVRILTDDPGQLAYGLAGGLGLVLDLAGDDRYRSANFSQGVGYFFGAGVKLDLGGNDEHAAARYGHAAGAHFGVGLFIDYRGEDRYTSTGPHYNGGAAWDRSVMLFVDAGEDNDLYDFRPSSGLGIADYRSWSVFIDEGGRDRYVVPAGMGTAAHDSMSGFFDLAGEDDYDGATQARGGNGRTLLDGAGGVFVDR
jgi:hypothetical protein